MLRFLCFLFLLSYPVLSQQIDWNTQIKNRPFSTGTAAPASASCDASSELGVYYLQTGNPATVVSQVWICSQTGASSYAWQAVSHKIGITAPTTCTVGQVFFDSDATAGENWYGCTATDTWTQLGGTGGGTSQFTFTRTGATTLSISAGSTGVGRELFSIASVSACTLTAAAGDICHFYLKDGIYYAAFSDTGSSVSCGSWSSITGIFEFPTDAVPIYKWTASSTPGNWDVSGGTNYQASVRGDIHKAGNGLLESSDANGVKTLAINTANVSQFTSSTDPASGSCTTGQTWTETDTGSTWDCTTTNTWTRRSKAFYGTAGCEIDGGGSVITAGGKCVVVMPYSGTLYRWTVLETTITPTASSSITIDIWKDTYANYQPTVADSITGAGTKPNITSGTKGQGTSFTNWTTTTVTAGDVLVFNVDSVTNAMKVLVLLEIDKT